ncbi:MAG: ATP-binding protein [Actinobacteria bacterium]|nr:ATP-binding protein [Actinomycetota bacterium]
MNASVAVVRSFVAHPSALYHMREFVRERAAESGVEGTNLHDLVLAVSEACANAVLHSSTPEVRLSWRELDEGVEVVVQDRGVFRRRVRLPEVDGGGGHGIPLMAALVDELTIREGTQSDPGTVVRLVKVGLRR